MLSNLWIQKNPDLLDAMLAKRNHPPMGEEISRLLRTYHQDLQQLEGLRQEKNQKDDAIAIAKTHGSSFDLLLEESTSLKHQETPLAQKVKAQKDQIDQYISLLPNLLEDSVPVGKDEMENVEIHRWGTPCKEPWTKDHSTLCGQWMDFDQATLVSGARFVYLRGAIARLERALGQWMLDTLLEEFGFQEVAIPYLVRESSMFSAGQLPKFKNELFCAQDSLFLIPTAEVSLVNWVKEKILELKEPLKLAALTPCFRREAGSAGRDTHGMMRHHQFNKVEMVVVCDAEVSCGVHETITRHAEVLLERLEIPYRRVLLCSGDTGAGSQKTYDLEAWIPSEGRYREISSCSNCGDFQSRRLKTRQKGKGGVLPHTLNGSALPTGRTLIAILENHQRPNGHIYLPEVLRPYMQGLDHLNLGE